MNHLRLFLAFCLTSPLALLPQNANAAQANGTVVFNISGAFKTPVTPSANAICSGIVFLAPDVTGSTTLTTLSAALLLVGGQQSASMPATIAAGGSTFTCKVTVPYFWYNENANLVLGMAYTVKASDPGGTSPGKTRQIIKTIPIPPNGTITTLSIPARL